MPGEGEESRLIRRLVESYHTLLDEALIVAIANDYNLQEPSGYDAARATLQDLAQHVPSEEATGFNPSGIPLMLDEGSDEARDDSVASTSLSLSQNCTALPRLTSFDNDSEEAKTLLLRSMFAELGGYDVKHSLQKANGNFQAALDDLLNIHYLKSTGQQPKGIDGFFQTGHLPPFQRKRKKKRNRGDGLSAQDPSLAHAEGQDEIEYIAERFGIRSDEVAGIYLKSGRSGGATVAELLDQYISHGVESKDDAGRQHADNLARKYRHVPAKYMPTVVHVAGSIPQFADDLAALLNKHFSKPAKGQRLNLSYRLTPLPQEDLEGEERSTGKHVVGKLPTGGLAAKTASSAAPMDLAQALRMADNHHQTKRETLATAAQLHRRGAANTLYRQAASFYTDRAREQARQAQQMTSTAADLLVEQQSTPDSIDLHGVLVHDGVRIARQKTQDWWGGLGEYRSRKAQGRGFTVITGLGRHSANGVSQMRQAVAAALLQDGWKLQVETGKFVVTGRR
ncbi:hypothetical protein CDD83_6765 [Cordyceps sp. RAO-2017]|nr:hypothetical protein CDD83_6765 [Cordyceps sp. RAO-2017]